jgi:hypothetical protein
MICWIFTFRASTQEDQGILLQRSRRVALEILASSTLDATRIVVRNTVAGNTRTIDVFRICP